MALVAITIAPHLNLFLHQVFTMGFQRRFAVYKERIARSISPI